MTRSVEPEQRLAEALRARATGAGRVGPNRSAAGGGSGFASPEVRLALLAALAGGVLVGFLLALLSLVAPGALPPI